MGLASNLQVPSLTLMAHHAMGWDLLCSGRFASAREHLEQGIALYNPQQDNPHISGVSQDPGVCFLVRTAWTLWSLGYPDQALARSREGLALAQELSHPFSLTFALSNVTVHHQLRREAWITHERAAALIALCREHGFSYNLEWGMVLQGWALAQQGEEEKGIAQLCQSFEAFRATGAYATGGQVAEGLRTLTEALDAVHTTGERYYESELYRLRGELLLNDERRMMNDERRTLKANPAQYTAEGEACFHNALKVARQQEAKSWELRAATSLARLWQQQGKRVEARDLLAPVYDWFGEGFDTQDLKDAKTLLDAFREE
jgi:predicted ATPase